MSSRDENSTTAAEAADEEAVYADGEYEGVGTGGMGGVIQVVVTVKGGRIIGVTYQDQETPEIGGKALPELVDQAIAGSGVIDGVSGASLTSGTFRAAVADALSKAVQ